MKMTEQQKIDAERKELNTILNRGLSFDLERVVLIPAKGFFGFLKKRVKKKEVAKFLIMEPTLSTLDRIAAEQLELIIDENVMSSDSGLTEAKKLTANHSRRLARIVAIAVLGNDYMAAIQLNGRTLYVPDDKRIEELTDLFFHNLKPTKLYQLAVLINTMSNYGDFCNSIRLLSAERTTMPIRIEENNEG
jgi:hypothetical protein